MNGSVAPTGRAAGRRPGRSWQLRPWPNDPTTMLLVVTDHAGVPTLADLEQAAVAARSQGVSRMRTSALFPRVAEAVLDAGFHAIDELALLRLDLRRPIEGAPSTGLRRHAGTRRLRSWHERRAADVDQDAFGSVWGNDPAGLRDVRGATPIHRARYVGEGRRLLGFAISGAGGDSGYIQRLAVASDARRRGIGQRLVIDAVGWMVERRLSAAHVNTGVDNHAALGLYEGLGFVRLDDRLTIAEIDLR